MMNMRHSGSCRYEKPQPTGSKVRGDQEIQGKSNEEVSDANLERIDSDLVMGRDNPHFSLHHSDISPAKLALSAGKDKFLTNLCSMFSLRIKLLGLKTSWKVSASRFLLIWVLLVTSIFQWIHFHSFHGVAKACVTNCVQDRQLNWVVELKLCHLSRGDNRNQAPRQWFQDVSTL